MPYRVATATTPLWADHQRTLKKGIVSIGTGFVCVEGFQDMLKTSSILYVPKGAATSRYGDGWLELNNCEKVTIVPEDEPTTTGDVPVVVSGKKKYLVTIEEVE